MWPRPRQAQGVHKFWVATVMPGYNDLRVRPGGGFAQDREGGGYYRRAWQAAIDSRPNWIVITSFNEWPEGTYIEPSAAYGDQYIGLTAHWSAQFKAGGQNAPQPADLPVQPQPEAPITPAQPQQTASTPETPTAYVDAGLLNVRSGPGTDYEVMTIVAAGATLPIRGRLADDPEWWQVEFAGQLGWVYAPLVTALGPLEQIEPVDAAESGQERDRIASLSAAGKSRRPRIANHGGNEYHWKRAHPGRFSVAAGSPIAQRYSSAHGNCRQSKAISKETFHAWHRPLEGPLVT